jgi:hypothetical protein
MAGPWPHDGGIIKEYPAGLLQHPAMNPFGSDMKSPYHGARGPNMNRSLIFLNTKLWFHFGVFHIRGKGLHGDNSLFCWWKKGSFGIVPTLFRYGGK